MTTSGDFPTQSILRSNVKGGRDWHRTRVLATSLAHPAVAFALVSILFGSAIIILTTPLQGPDEPGHFLHVYAMSKGIIIPTDVDAKGRKGIFIPARLYDSYSAFEAPDIQAHKDNRRIWADYMRVLAAQRRAARLSGAPHIPRRPAPVFIENQGQEGYSPAAYLPAMLALLLARLAGFDFVEMLFSMRFAGLAAMTAVIAYAIAIAGPLRWAFFMIGMLPAALYGRSVISADGAALAYTMLITALCFRIVRSGNNEERTWEHSLFMTLCVLSKPPQVAFIILPAMTRSLKELRKHWRRTALIVLPGCILTTLWLMSMSGQIEAVRILQGTDLLPEQFTALWKFRFMLEHPLHFPKALIASCLRWGHDYWLQLIGVLGWLDTPLRPWAYAALSVTLVVACLVPLGLERSARYRIALVSGSAALGYCLGVFAIFFVVWTPIAATEVQGVQGRYFLPTLPSIALVISALLNRGFSQTTVAIVALAGAILSGGAAIEAILRVTGLPFGLSN